MCNVLEGGLRIFPDYPIVAGNFVFSSSFKDVQTIILLKLGFTIFHDNMKRRKEEEKSIYFLLFIHIENQETKDQRTSLIYLDQCLCFNIFVW